MWCMRWVTARAFNARGSGSNITLEREMLLQWRWSNTSMVSLVLYSSGSGGVMVLVSGNNAAAMIVVLCC